MSTRREVAVLGARNDLAQAVGGTAGIVDAGFLPTLMTSLKPLKRQMPKDTLDLALKRLSAAIDLLEAVEARRARAEASRANLEEEYAVMQDDRTRLAVELDATLARNKALIAANTEVARRLEFASTTIRAMLAAAVSEQEDG